MSGMGIGRWRFSPSSHRTQVKYGVELGLGRATIDPWLSGPGEAFHFAQGAIEVDPGGAQRC